MTLKALLFVNGEPPSHYPHNLSDYAYIACTDGAYHNYLHSTDIMPNFIIGDLDSISTQPVHTDIQLIETPDQNKTDFEKAILYLADLGVTSFDIYGANGRATDHFLGNLSVAIRYYQQFELNFYDNYSHFFFAKNPMILDNVKDKTISLIPLSTIPHLTLYGFKYPLYDVTLAFDGLTSLRNQAQDDTVKVEFESGDLLVFVAL